MKKIIFILSFILCAAILNAQSTARTSDTHVMAAGATYYEYTGVAADTVGTDQDSLIFNFYPNKNCPVIVSARVEGTRTGTTDDYEMKLQAKVFPNSLWPAADLAPISVDSVNSATTSQELYPPSVALDAAQAADVVPFRRIWRVIVASDGTVAATDKFTVTKVIWKVYELK